MLVTPALQVVHRVITCHLLEQTGFKVDEAASGAVALIQRFGSAANLNIHLHCLVLDGVYRRTEGEPVFVEVPAPTDEQLQALLHKIIAAIMEAAGTRADPPAAGPASAPSAPGAGARRSSKGGVVRRAAGRGCA